MTDSNQKELDPTTQNAGLIAPGIPITPPIGIDSTTVRDHVKAILSKRPRRPAQPTSYLRVAFVGCGYVANMYRLSLPLHENLELVGALDRDAARAKNMAGLCNCRAYHSLEELLGDNSVDLVLNLTNPREHYQITRDCLRADKHVYTEKPLAMDLNHANELVELADERGLCLSSAPCTLLAEAAQSLWKAIRDRRVGDVRLVYAEMDDGMVHRMPYQKWINEAGTPWPYQNEFETGCTVEHAGYVLTWLAAFFGPAESVTAFSDCLVPNKFDDPTAQIHTPDFSVACIRFRTGVVARLTCGIMAPHNHKFTVMGEEGVITLKDPRCDRSAFYIQRYTKVRRKLILLPAWKKQPLLNSGQKNEAKYRGSQRRDFCRGIAEISTALHEGRECRLNARFALHVNELTLAIQNARQSSAAYRLTTTFDPITPMEWAL